MKKLLAFLMALTMVLSLAACGGNDDDDEKEEKKDKNSVSDLADEDEDEDETTKARKNDYSYIKDETLREFAENGDAEAAVKSVTTSKMKKIYKLVEEGDFTSLTAAEEAKILRSYGLDAEEDDFDDGEDSYYQSGDYTIFNSDDMYIVFDESEKIAYGIDYDYDEYYEVEVVPFDYLNQTIDSFEMTAYITVDSNEVICFEYYDDYFEIFYDGNGKIIVGVYEDSDEYYFDEDFNEITEEEADEKYEKFCEEVEDNFDIYCPI